MADHADHYVENNSAKIGEQFLLVVHASIVIDKLVKQRIDMLVNLPLKELSDSVNNIGIQHGISINTALEEALKEREDAVNAKMQSKP